VETLQAQQTEIQTLHKRIAELEALLRAGKEPIEINV
jgi:hypothetical protein